MKGGYRESYTWSKNRIPKAISAAQICEPISALQIGLHVLEIKGDRVGPEKLVADHAREMEAERVFKRKGAVIDTLDVFFLYVAQGNLMHGVRVRSSASRRRRHLEQLCFPPA